MYHKCSTYEICRRFWTEKDANAKYDRNNSTNQACGFCTEKCSKNINKKNTGSDQQLEERSERATNGLFSNFSAVNLKCHFSFSSWKCNLIRNTLFTHRSAYTNTAACYADERPPADKHDGICCEYQKCPPSKEWK